MMSDKDTGNSAFIDGAIPQRVYLTLPGDDDRTADRPRRVDFLIVGAQRAGTTALATLLARRPDICLMPGKEAHLFDRDAIHAESRLQEFRPYHDLFANYRPGQIVGEATPTYMFFPDVAARIRDYNPEMKLIVLLRNPADRAYSHYILERRRGRERLPFWLAIRLERRRLRRGQRRGSRNALVHHTYVRRGQYRHQMERLLEHFPSEQVRVVLNEDLAENPAEVLQTICCFLGAREAEPIEAERVFEQTYAPMGRFSRAYLRRRYRKDVEWLEQFLGRDLPAWR